MVVQISQEDLRGKTVTQKKTTDRPFKGRMKLVPRRESKITIEKIKIRQEKL